MDPSFAPLVIVADAYPNFSSCGLPFYLSGETPDWRGLAHRDRGDLEAAGLRLRLNHTATEIDADRHTLTVRDPDGEAQVIGYDRLIVGTGAVPARPIEGLGLDGVHVLHSMAHVFALQERVTGKQTRRAIIVGAGYIGLELADAFRYRGLSVTVVEMVDQVLSTVDTELAAPLRETLEEHGVTVATGVTVHAIEPSGDGLRVISDDDEEREADVVVVAAGVVPETALAQTAGMKLGEFGAIVVDRVMRTGVEDVYAAGDCVETWHALLSEPTYLPLGTTAHNRSATARGAARLRSPDR